MASASVTNPVTIEADIVSAFLTKPFSDRRITEKMLLSKNDQPRI